MGVNNTRYERVTVYLKKSQVEFLNELINEMSNPNIVKPSRSDVVRAILDKYCNTEDWQTSGLIDMISKKSNLKR